MSLVTRFPNHGKDDAVDLDTPGVPDPISPSTQTRRRK